MKARIHRPLFDSCACRIHAEIVAAFPVILRPDGPGTKTAAAIRTDIVQDTFDARAAEGAFKRANHRVRGVWRKRRVAVFANWSQFQHVCFYESKGQGQKPN